MKDIFERIVSNNHKLLNFNTLIAATFSFLLGLSISAFVLKNPKEIVVILTGISVISILLGLFIRKLAWNINKFLKDKKSWPEHSLKAMIFSFIPAFSISFFLAFISLSAIYFFTQNQEINHLGILIWAFSFSLIFNLGLYAVLFLEKWKETIVREENLKREQLNLQYDNLVSRANPNMLFSSLKSLKEKVRKNQDDAVHFVKQISDFYRYSLDQRNKDIIELTEELNYIRNLTQLLQAQFPQIEFSENINIENNVFLIPFSVGSLIEYVILNSPEIGKLEINIKNEKNEYLVLKINGLLKASFPLELTGTIQEKYSILSENKLQFEIKENYCQINFPLIDVK